jgi:hypothetical protein
LENLNLVFGGFSEPHLYSKKVLHKKYKSVLKYLKCRMNKAAIMFICIGLHINSTHPSYLILVLLAS